MGLAGFKARNHPQQVLAVGPRACVDERATPVEFFARLNRGFAFTIDVCAIEQNAKLPRYWTPADNGLAQSWAGERVWCNPPFSSIPAWVEKASSEWATGRVELIVMLLPANRTELSWWQRYIEPVRDRAGSDLRVEFLAGRIRFGMGSAAPLPNTRPPFGCCLAIWK